MKEMTSVATTMMSEEEKAEMEREMNEGRGAASPSTSTALQGEMPTSPTAPAHAVNGEATPATSSSLTPPSSVPGEGGEQKDLAAHAHKEKEIGRAHV